MFSTFTGLHDVACVTRGARIDPSKGVGGVLSLIYVVCISTMRRGSECKVNTTCSISLPESAHLRETQLSGQLKMYLFTPDVSRAPLKALRDA